MYGLNAPKPLGLMADLQAVFLKNGRKKMKVKTMLLALCLFIGVCNCIRCWGEIRPSRAFLGTAYQKRRCRDLSIHLFRFDSRGVRLSGDNRYQVRQDRSFRDYGLYPPRAEVPARRQARQRDTECFDETTGRSDGNRFVHSLKMGIAAKSP